VTVPGKGGRPTRQQASVKVAREAREVMALLEGVTSGGEVKAVDVAGFGPVLNAEQVEAAFRHIPASDVAAMMETLGKAMRLQGVPGMPASRWAGLMKQAIEAIRLRLMFSIGQPKGRSESSSVVRHEVVVRRAPEATYGSDEVIEAEVVPDRLPS